MVISNPSSSTIDPELVISHRPRFAIQKGLFRKLSDSLPPSRFMKSAHFISFDFLPRLFVIVNRDVALYALGIGTCSGDAVNEKELSYVYHKSGQKFIKAYNLWAKWANLRSGKFTVPPTARHRNHDQNLRFHLPLDIGTTTNTDTTGRCELTSLGLEGIHGLQYDPRLLLHGQHYIEIYRPLPSNSCVLNQFKVAGLHDKGKATIIELETTSYIKESGEVLCMNRSSIYLRGSGGFSSASQPYSYKTYSDSQPSRFSIPKHQPTAIFEETTQLSQLIGNTPLTNGGFGSLEFSKNSSGTTILMPLPLELRLLHLKTLPPLHLKTILLLLLYLSHLSLSLHFLSMTRSSSFTRVQQEFNLELRRQGALVEKSLVDSLLACCRTKIHIVLHGGWKPRPSWLGNVVGRFVVLCSWFFLVLAVLQVVMVFWGRCQKHLALVVSRMLSWSREGLNRSCSRSLDGDLEGGRTWFARPILHGLCTLGFAVRAIVSSFCDGEATAVKNIFGRFLLHSYLSDKGEGAKSSCALWLCATEAELFPVESVPEIMMNMDYSFFKCEKSQKTTHGKAPGSQTEEQGGESGAFVGGEAEE
ncbi:hypothetical protein ZIOFF_003624 [Zingiber officinale]|uniref:Peroxisomal multifunctional enzyme type 2-like N-terminal domain-containing protein n=1 Tax=Zingiber officinale TaxID=94328 RepID=A0A8J5LZX8_ZINOF|nr:hypothetical protein ZIOFF_003624 [Zingiber officinale]